MKTKMRVKTRAGAAAVALLLLASVAPAAQAQDGSAILARVDSVMNAPKDMQGVWRMTLVDQDGSRSERVLRFYQLGPEKRLVRFERPADVRGVGFLRLSKERMYLYLPAFRRVRRIASSIQNEGFMGTDFSYEDMAQTRFAVDYEVVGVQDDDETYTLTLEPREGADVSYARLVMVVRKDNGLYTRIDFYDEGGERVKTLNASEMEEAQGYWYAKRLEMVTWKSGHRTILELDEVSFDSGLSDDLFTQRALKRPA